MLQIGTVTSWSIWKIYVERNVHISIPILFLPVLLNSIFPVDNQAAFFWQVLALSEIPHKSDTLYPSWGIAESEHLFFPIRDENSECNPEETGKVKWINFKKIGYQQ